MRKVLAGLDSAFEESTTVAFRCCETEICDYRPKDGHGYASAADRNEPQPLPTTIYSFAEPITPPMFFQSTGLESFFHFP